MEQLNAVVFVLSSEFDPHASRCVQYCMDQGYRLVGVVRDSWDAVLKLLVTRQADIVVVATEEQLPRRRRPRIEVVANAGTGRSERRTRIIRRSAAK